MITRTSTMASSMIRLNDLSSAAKRLDEASRQITTGKVINKMSDNPGDALNSLAQRSELRRVTQLSRNIDDAQGWLNQADSALQSVDDHLTSAKSLLIQATNATMSDSARAAIASELDSIRSSLLATANTTRLGRPIFAGTASTPSAYDASGAYLGDTADVVRTIETSTISEPMVINRTGPAVFGTYNATDPAAGDVFQLLEHLSAAITANDSAAISTGINSIATASSRVGKATVELGARASLLDDAQLRLGDSQTNLKNGISQLEDTDLAEATINYKSREVAYNAALQVTATVSQLSLLDFLR